MTDVAGMAAAADVLTDGRRPVPDAAAAHLIVDEAQGRCANCETPLTGAFCHACGQKAHLHARLRDLLHEALEGIAHFDGRLWRTFPLLAFNPGRLSREWRAGRRVRYVAPFSTFLFAVFLLFLIPMLTGHHFINLPSNAEEAAMRQNSIVRFDVGEAPDADSRPGRAAARFQEWVQHRYENRAYYGAKVESLAYKLSFLIVPMSMVILWLLLWWRRGYSFYDHGVVALYGTGFFTLMLTAATLVSLAVSAAGFVVVGLSQIVMLLGAIHAWFHLKGAYGLGGWGATWRTALLGVMSAVGFGTFMVGVVLLGFAS